ncbi:MAG: hypothetical protein KA313_03115 [Pseudarcicella sp.]|jgi:hypothetical protein|nr:hypothetical protein [Pseudarcicella sp.]MBP6410067.1 hypothetical protein [Pseudarcicella sp.]
MHFISELEGSSPKLKISLYHWNSKFFVKFETPDLEQVYKFPEMDIDEKELKKAINKDFISKITKRFHEMYMDINEIIN